MAYNIPEKYQDLTPAAQLDNKTLNKMVWMSCFLQASFNYERMQACGWLWGILPGLQKIHTNKEDLKASMAHNLDFLNTHPFLVTFVMGIVLSLEQNKADTQTIRSVRISAAGPLGGIGDALFWLTLVPITAGITANMALNNKSIIGAILFLAIFNAVQFAIRYFLMHWSYNLGTKAVTMLTSNAKEFTRAASILGIFTVGALIANYGTTSLRIMIVDPAINVQSLLDGILPKLIPLLITVGLYFLIKKGWTPIKCIILILITGIIGCAFGIFAGDSKAIDADGHPIPGGYNPLVQWYDYPAPAAPEKTGQQAWDALQNVVDQLAKEGTTVTMPE
ncbi:PTS system mannose/fructose/sorbose family transporter subunit IID [[Eubacterium] hominis]|uniref:PTS system mannose/fructose/sorbose family transporter subunit IID n=2 Tax=[Eubacterium] hominis TaxID=2764325 RepID=A0A7G9GNJ4_9FIRM|nr:PTS system mannose/fructose/sorbose family transporter subunit IID [[Eubacterium] hominis]